MWIIFLKPNAELTWGPMLIRFTMLLWHGRLDRKCVLVYIFTEKLFKKKNSVTEFLRLSLLRSAETFLTRFDFDRRSTSNQLTLQQLGDCTKIKNNKCVMFGVFDHCAGRLRSVTGQSKPSTNIWLPAAQRRLSVVVRILWTIYGQLDENHLMNTCRKWPQAWESVGMVWRLLGKE